MALGVVAFALTALLGMLPIGLNLSRNAADTSVASRIVQKISGHFQQADFDTLPMAENQIRYFDEYGTELPSADESIYWARVTVFSNTKLPGSGQLGGDNLARIIIQVAHNPAGRATVVGADGTWQESEGIRVVKRSLFVARNTPKN